jgi:hypothetical protein
MTAPASLVPAIAVSRDVAWGRTILSDHGVSKLASIPRRGLEGGHGLRGGGG